MKRLPYGLRLLLTCLGAAAVAPPAVFLLGGTWRDAFTARAFASVLVYACTVGLPAGLVMPAVVSRVGKRGLRLPLAMVATMLALTATGCLAAGCILIALGLQRAETFWSVYAFTVRAGGTVAVLLVLALYIYRSLTTQLEEGQLRLQQQELDQERERKLALEARLASLESRIHPHFFFNTLNSISSLIPVDPERAEQVVGRLAALLRSSLDTSRQPLIPLGAELDLVRNYLEIEKARFGDRLRYSFAVPPEVTQRLVPPLAVQSLVENAVKHAVATQEAGCEIEVVAEEDASGLRVEVRDNGPGFALDSVWPGHGLENLVSRLEALFGAAARLEVACREGRCVVAVLLPGARAEASAS